MKNHDNSTKNKRLDKNSASISQLETIFHFLKENAATASMLTESTGITQKSITRDKRALEKRGLLAEVRKGYCKMTIHLAWYATTNKNHFPETNQFEVFE